MKHLLAILLAVLASCSSLGQLESLPPDEFEALQARTSLVTRVVAHRAEIPQERLDTVADALSIVAADPLALAGPNVITRALQDAGLTDQEAMLAVMLVEDFLRARFSWGTTTSPLGPNARALLLTVAAALRAPIVTPDEEQKGDELLSE